MSLRVYYEVLNQKGSPALFTDTLANRPAFGFQGRLFISTDSGQIFEDTGTAWTLVADAGVGGGTLSSVCLNGNTTATGIVITAGGLSSTTGTFSGIVTTPQVKASTSAGLSINGNSGTQVALLGAGGSANMTLYGGLTGTSGSFTSMSVLNAGVGAVTTEFVNVSDQVQINIKSTGGATYTSNSCNIGAVSSQGFYITRGTSGGAIFDISTSGTYSYILPAANGTLALTSNLSSYLPLAGGTLTGALSGTSANFSGDVGIGTNSPLSRLQVVPASLSSTIVRFGEASGTTGKQLLFGIDSTTGRGEIQSVWQGTSNTPLVLNLAGGNVGIGTGSVPSKLTILQSSDTLTNGIRQYRSNNSDFFETYITSGFGGLNDTYNFYNSFTSGIVAAIDRQGKGYFANNVLIGTTTDNGNKLQVNGSITSSISILNGSTYIISSSSVTNISDMSSGIITLRDQSNGGSALVFYENGQTPVIVAQAGITSFTTGAPGPTEIQLANKIPFGGISALGGSSRNNVQIVVGTFKNS
jgi:hypothetical protein